MRKGAYTQGGGNGRAATGSAGRARGVERIDGAPVQIVVREPAPGKCRDIAAADDDGARLDPVVDGRIVLLGDDVPIRDDAVGRRRPREIDVGLDRHRHAMKNAKLPLVTDGGVGGVGRSEGLVGMDFGKRIEGGIDLLRSRQAALHRFPAGYVTGPDGLGKVQGIPAPEFVFHDGSEWLGTRSIGRRAGALHHRTPARDLGRDEAGKLLRR
ncbi:hypothetical protein D3C71_1475780 [compost metagenome]